MEDEDLLSLETRRRLYEIVRARPGAAGREIQRTAGTGWGETVYHLERMCGAGLLLRERDEHQDHYFLAAVPLPDRRLLQIFRSSSARRLLVALLERPDRTVPELGERTGLSAGRISVHLRRLMGAGVVTSGRRERFRTFSVREPDPVLRLLVQYRAGFADGWVEGVLATWSDLFRP
jgi:predicted transcriptional regulator